MSNILERENVFLADEFSFPYTEYRFEGQESDEKILYVTREAKIMLYWRQIGVAVIGVVFLIILLALGAMLNNFGMEAGLVLGILGVMGVITTIVVMIWLDFTWRRTLGIVTHVRLIKFLQINPINNKKQTLPIKNIVDTQSETRKLVEKILGLGSFSVRSGANSSGVATHDAEKGEMRINRKDFYWLSITNSDDLENYVNKLMNAVGKYDDEKMQTFRPFIANAKTGQRQKMMDEYPEYWS